MNKEQEIIQRVLELTRKDKLLWNYDAQNCYVATCEEMKFQVYCQSKEASFVVAAERCEIGTDAVMMLCNAIALQSIRRRKRSEKLDEIIERLKKICSTPVET